LTGDPHTTLHGIEEKVFESLSDSDDEELDAEDSTLFPVPRRFLAR
jgi:hypothetical protein